MFKLGGIFTSIKEMSIYCAIKYKALIFNVFLNISMDALLQVGRGTLLMSIFDN